MPRKRANDRTGSLQRAVQVLKQLARGSPEACSLKAIASRLKLPESTVHRLLAVMCSEQMVRRDPLNRRYFLGPLALEIGACAAPRNDIRQSARVILERLAQKVGDTVYLTVRDGRDAVCIDRHEGFHPIQVQMLQIGSRRPLGLGAGGLAILAALPNEEQEMLVPSLIDAVERQGRVSARMLRASIQNTRQSGYSLIRNRITPGTTAIGVHFVDDRARTIGAISIAAVDARLKLRRERQLSILLRDAAGTLEGLLRRPPQVPARLLAAMPV